MYQIIKADFPLYEPPGYLGGTERHDSYTWLAGALIGSKHRMYGSIGKTTMELAQAGHHLFYGTYLAYLPQMKAAWLLFLLAPWDRGIRRVAKNRLEWDTHQLLSNGRVQVVWRDAFHGREGSHEGACRTFQREVA